MNIRIEHRLGIQATSDRIWEILSAFQNWHGWHPIYPEAVGAVKIGATVELLEKLPNLPERRITATMVDWTPREQILLKRSEGFLVHRLQYFEIEELGPANCIFSSGVIFSGLRAKSAARRYARAFKLGYGMLGEALKAKAETETA